MIRGLDFGDDATGRHAQLARDWCEDILEGQAYEGTVPAANTENPASSSSWAMKGVGVSFEEGMPSLL